MSHFSKVKSEIKDLEALEEAARKMGFQVARNAPCRYYYGSRRKDFVIKLPGSYDVAITKSEGDSYAIEADFFAGHVAKYVGKNGDLLLQQYAIEKVKIEAFQKGLTVEETQEGNATLLKLTDNETGGQIIIACHPGGNTEVRTTGFQGEGCMKFRSIEESLGNIEKLSYTDEYYLPEQQEEERIQQWSE